VEGYEMKEGRQEEGKKRRKEGRKEGRTHVKGRTDTYERKDGRI
jgi:hypothetical protein